MCWLCWGSRRPVWRPVLRLVVNRNTHTHTQAKYKATTSATQHHDEVNAANPENDTHWFAIGLNVFLYYSSFDWNKVSGMWNDSSRFSVHDVSEKGTDKQLFIRMFLKMTVFGSINRENWDSRGNRFWIIARIICFLASEHQHNIQTCVQTSTETKLPSSKVNVKSIFTLVLMKEEIPLKINNCLQSVKFSKSKWFTHSLVLVSLKIGHQVA